MIPTEEQPLGMFADYSELIWPIQIIAYLLMIVSILLSVWLIRVRNAKRRSTPPLGLALESSSPGWSLDLTNKG